MDLTNKKNQSYQRGLYRLAHHCYDPTEPSIIAEWSNEALVGVNSEHTDYLVKFTNFDGNIIHALVVTAHTADLALAMALEYLVTEYDSDFQFPSSVEPINFEARLIQTSFKLNTFDAQGYINQLESDPTFLIDTDQDALDK